jgi:uncharacterized membrane protein
VTRHGTGWAEASLWLLGFGLGMGALAAVAGLTDFLGDARIRSGGDAVKHMLANVTAVVIEVINLALRFDDFGRIPTIGILSFRCGRPDPGLQRLDGRRAGLPIWCWRSR